MKKLIALSLAVLFVLGAAACGKKEESKTENKAETTAATQAATTAPATAPATADSASAVVTDGSKLGELQTVAAKEDFVIKGLILLSDSGHHEYGTIDDNIGKGYLTKGLFSEYYLNEWIGIYADTDAALFNVYVVPNEADKDYAAVTETELRQTCEEKGFPVMDSVTPDKTQHGYIGGLYVNPDSSLPGLYNMFFAKDGAVGYMVQLKLEPEA